MCIKYAQSSICVMYNQSSIYIRHAKTNMCVMYVIAMYTCVLILETNIVSIKQPQREMQWSLCYRISNSDLVSIYNAYYFQTSTNSIYNEISFKTYFLVIIIQLEACLASAQFSFTNYGRSINKKAIVFSSNSPVSTYGLIHLAQCINRPSHKILITKLQF